MSERRPNDLNGPAIEYTITILEQIAEGEDGAGATLGALPDVSGIILDIAGTECAWLADYMDTQNQLGGKRGMYLHVNIWLWRIPHWFSIHPNG